MLRRLCCRSTLHNVAKIIDAPLFLSTRPDSLDSASALGNTFSPRGKLKSWSETQEELNRWRDSPPTALAASELYRSIQSMGRPPEDVDIPFLINQTKTLLPELNKEALAVVYYWCCKSKVGDADFLATVSRQILEGSDLASYTTKQRVLMIYATGWLVKHELRDRVEQVRNASELYQGMNVFVDKVAQSITMPNTMIKLKEQDLANLIYSLGLLRYHSTAVIEPLLSQIEKPSFLPRYLEQELANILSGISGLGMTGHPTVAVLAAEVVERERLRMYKEPELCSIFHSFATLGYSNPDAVAILLKETVRTARMPAFKDYQLSNLIYSFDRLQVKDDRVWRMLLKEVLGPDRLPNFEPHQLANIIFALGRSDYRDIHSIHNLTNHAMEDERLKKYTTREYSLILFGLSRIAYNDRVVLRQISQELSRPGRLVEEGLSSKAQCGILLSLATMRHTDMDLVHRYFMEVLHQHGILDMEPNILAQYIFCLGKFKVPSTGPAQSVILYLLQSKEKLNALTHRSLGMLIYGLGQMGPDSRRYMPSIVQLLSVEKGRAERFSVQDLAMVIYSFGLLHLDAYELVDGMVLNFTRPDRLVKASTQHLSNFIYGLGQMRFRLRDVCLQMLEQEIALDSRIRNYSNQELANIIYSIGLLNIDHRPGIQHAIEKLTEESTRPERLSQFREMELNCLLTGLSYLRYREPDILLPILEEIVLPTRLNGLKPQEIASVLHVIAQLGVCPDEICEKLLAEAQRPERLDGYDLPSIVMIIYSLGRLQNTNYPEAIAALSKHIMESTEVNKLGEQHLANFLYGVAHARYDAPEVLEAIFTEITRHHRLPRFSSGEVLNITKSVLALRARGVQVKGLDDVARIFAIEMTSLNRIPNYTPSQLTHVLQTLNVLRNKNVATIFPILNELAKPDRLHHLSPIDVSRAVFAVGPMAFVSRSFHPQLAIATKPLLKQVVLGSGVESLNCQGITELVVGLSMLGLQDKYVLDNVSNEIIKPSRLRSFRAWHLSRMFYAVAQLRYDNLELVRAIASELSRQDRAQRLDYRHWSNILTAVLMLKFKDEDFANLIEKQIHMPQYESQTVTM